jgi:hypothetical protein
MLSPAGIVKKTENSGYTERQKYKKGDEEPGAVMKIIF